MDGDGAINVGGDKDGMLMVTHQEIFILTLIIFASDDPDVIWAVINMAEMGLCNEELKELLQIVETGIYIPTLQIDYWSWIYGY